MSTAFLWVLHPHRSASLEIATINIAHPGLVLALSVDLKHLPDMLVVLSPPRRKRDGVAVLAAMVGVVRERAVPYTLSKLDRVVLCGGREQ